MTITEAMAEIKVIVKRVNKKIESLKEYVIRPDAVRDPLEDSGGSTEYVRSEVQSIRDLFQRIMDLRVGIQKKNQETELTIEGVSRSVSEWLTWRREVASLEKLLTDTLWGIIVAARREQRSRAQALESGEVKNQFELVCNVDEADLLKTRETNEAVLEQLDGQLSLLNATVNL